MDLEGGRAIWIYSEIYETFATTMSRQAVMKHLIILEDANLIATVWSGREKRHYLNPIPIQAIQDRWIKKFEKSRIEALSVLKFALEGNEKKGKKNG